MTPPAPSSKKPAKKKALASSSAPAKDAAPAKRKKAAAKAAAGPPKPKKKTRSKKDKVAVATKPKAKPKPKEETRAGRKSAKKTAATKAAPRKAGSAKSSAKKTGARDKGAKAGSKGLVSQARAKEIVDLLIATFPDEGSALNSRNPFELLVATILSAQCTDARVNIVSPALFEKYPTAEKMAVADEAELKGLIHTTGFFNQKTKSLLSMSTDIVDKHGGEVPGSLDALTELRGVGRKTAWCVLGAYFDQHGIIVDTHLSRVTRRLGLHDQADPVKIEMALNRLVDEPRRTQFSHAIQVIGRGPCAARKTRCDDCILNQLCPSAELSASKTKS